MKIGLLTLVSGIVFSLLAAGEVRAKKEQTLGRIEAVILLPWAIKLPARVDTGATVSSLDARELHIQGEIAEFKLPGKHGDTKLRVPIVDWHHVRSPGGIQKRPVIEIELCIGSKKIRTRVNLTDRSMVKYPLILGRSILKEGFVVDVRRSRILPPKCSENGLSQNPD